MQIQLPVHAPLDRTWYVTSWRIWASAQALVQAPAPIYKGRTRLATQDHKTVISFKETIQARRRPLYFNKDVLASVHNVRCFYYPPCRWVKRTPHPSQEEKVEKKDEDHKEEEEEEEEEEDEEE